MTLSDTELRELLGRTRTVAVVGLSDKPDRDSYQIAQYLQSQGYRIIPVNPMVSAVLGEKSYPNLAEIPAEFRIDIVDIFRRSEQVLPVVEEALHRGVGAIWMQLGIRNAEAARKAESAGVPVVEDLCIMVQHRRLGMHRPVSGSPGAPTRTS
jgi:predicted CoA-binding protein